MRPEIKEFAEALEAKMTKYYENRGGGWEEKVDWWFNELEEKIGEPVESLAKRCPEALSAWCLDVAIFALLLHQLISGEG